MKFDINEFLSMIENQVLYMMAQFNEILRNDSKHPEEIGQAREEYLGQMDYLSQQMGDAKSDIDTRRTYDQMKVLTDKYIRNMYELGEIDIDKMIAISLFYSLLKYWEAHGIHGPKISMPNKEKAGNLKWGNNIKAIQYYKTLLDGKNIEFTIRTDSEMYHVSSVDLCAAELEGEYDGSPKDKKLAQKRKRAKEQKDVKKQKRKEANLARLNKIKGIPQIEQQEQQQYDTEGESQEILLDNILISLVPSDFAFCYYDGIERKLDATIYSRIMQLDSNFTQEEKKMFITQNEMKSDTLYKILESEYYSSEMKKIFLENIGDINLDKLLLIAAYRRLEFIDYHPEGQTEEERKEKFQDIKEILEGILKQFDHSRDVRCMVMPINKNNPNEIETYRLRDLEKDITRILPSVIFASDKLIHKTKSSLNSGEQRFMDIDPYLLEFMQLSEEDISKYSAISSDNFRYAVEHWNLPHEKIKAIAKASLDIDAETIKKLADSKKLKREDIVELFCLGKISAIDIHGYILPDEVMKLYETQSITNEQLITLYHNADIDSESMGILVLEYGIEQQIVNALEEETLSLQDLNNLYDNGSMNNLNSDYIFQCYVQKAEKQFTTLKPLFWGFQVGKLSIEQLDELYTKYGVVKEEDLYEAALKGYFSTDKIEELYLRSLLSDMVLDSLCENKIISQEMVDKIKSKLQLDVLKASYPFSGKIETVEIEDVILLLPDSKAQMGIGNGKSGTSKKGTGMDPEFKLSVLANLKVPVVKLSEDCFVYDKDNPFYDYEFFVITDEDGKIDENSIVIAEKLYKSREKREAWAYGDATYLFTLKDFKRIGKKSKAEIKEFMEGKTSKEDTEKSCKVQQEIESYNAYQGIQRVIHRSKKSWAIKLAKKVSAMLGKAKTSIYLPEKLQEIETAPLELLKALEDRE